jgi:hypothetical protein
MVRDTAVAVVAIMQTEGMQFEARDSIDRKVGFLTQRTQRNRRRKDRILISGSALCPFAPLRQDFLNN